MNEGFYRPEGAGLLVGASTLTYALGRRLRALLGAILRSDGNMAEAIQQQIVREVSAWPGVTIAAHRFGGVEFRLGRRELGHCEQPLPAPITPRPRNRPGQKGR